MRSAFVCGRYYRNGRRRREREREGENARGRSSRVVSARVQMVTILAAARVCPRSPIVTSEDIRVYFIIGSWVCPRCVCICPSVRVRACRAPVPPRPRDRDSDSPDRRDVAFDSLDLRFHLRRAAFPRPPPSRAVRKQSIALVAARRPVPLASRREYREVPSRAKGTASDFESRSTLRRVLRI